MYTDETLITIQNDVEEQKTTKKNGLCYWFYVALALNCLLLVDWEFVGEVLDGEHDLSIMFSGEARDMSEYFQEEAMPSQRRRLQFEQLLKQLGPMMGGGKQQGGAQAANPLAGLMQGFMGGAKQGQVDAKHMMHGKPYSQADKFYKSIQMMHSQDANQGRSSKYIMYMIVIFTTTVTCSHCFAGVVPPAHCYVMTSSMSMNALINVFKEKVAKDKLANMPDLMHYREAIGADRSDLWEIECAILAMKVALDQTEKVTEKRATDIMARIGEIFHYHPKVRSNEEFSQLYKEAGLTGLDKLDAQEKNVICPEAEAEARERGDITEVLPLPSDIDRISLEHSNLSDPLCFFSLRNYENPAKRKALRSLVCVDPKGKIGAYNSLFLDDDIDYCEKKLNDGAAAKKAAALEQAAEADAKERQQIMAQAGVGAGGMGDMSSAAFKTFSGIASKHPVLGAIMPREEEDPAQRLPKLKMLRKFVPDLRKYGTYLLNKKQRPELYNVRTGLSSVVMHPVMQRFQHALERNSGCCNVPFRRFKRTPNKAGFAWYKFWTWCKCRFTTNDELRKRKIVKYMGKIIVLLRVLQGEQKGEQNTQQQMTNNMFGAQPGM